MAVASIRCPYCARAYSVDSRLLGRSGRCKDCGRSFPLSEVVVPKVPSGSAGGSGRDDRDPVSLVPASRMQPPEPTLELPERFGRYRILRKLGEGGMGAVYLAHDEQLDRRVALKVPHFTPRDGPEILERFEREARAAARLNHPGLCPIFDVGQIDGVHYLTMPYIEGKPLSEAFELDTPIPPRLAAAVVRKLALALQEAHNCGIVHRDLKPSNIMANRHRELMIMDFGLARQLDQGDARLTRNGTLLGTPLYMAPEQVAGDPAAIGPACDIYSLGVILYELLAGRRPFDGPVTMVLAWVLVAEPSRPTEHRPDLDPAVEAICLKAMAKKPSDRYTTMTEFATALGEYVAGRSLAVDASPHETFETPPLPSSDPVPRQGPGPESPVENLFKNLVLESTSATSLGNRDRGKDERPGKRRTITRAVGVLSVLSSVLLIFLMSRGQGELARGPTPSLVPDGSTAGSRTDVSSGRVVNSAEPSPAGTEIRAAQSAAAAKSWDLVAKHLDQCPIPARDAIWAGLKRRLDARIRLVDGPGRGAQEPGVDPSPVLTLQADPPTWFSYIDFHPDGSRIVTCDPLPQSVIVWDAETGRPIRTFDVADSVWGGVWRIRFSPDGKWIGANEFVLDLQSGDRIKTYPNGSFADFSPDSSRALVSLASGANQSGRQIGVIDLASLRTLQTFPELAADSRDERFSPDGRIVASSALDQTIRLWRADDGAEILTIPDSSNRFRISPDSRRIVAGMPSLAVYDAETATQVLKLVALSTEGVESKAILYSPDGRWIAGGCSDGMVRVWDAVDGAMVLDFRAHTQVVWGLAWDPGSTRIATASEDQTAKVWKLTTEPSP